MENKTYKYPFYIKGNSIKPFEATKVLANKAGITLENEYACISENRLYYINNKEGISSTKDDTTIADLLRTYFEELVISEEYKFRNGDHVLIRNHNTDKWKEAIFSFYDKDDNFYSYCTVGGRCWKKCIPFDINKLGKITD